MPSPSFEAGYPFAFRSYTGNGATTTFSLPFPYLAQAHIKVYVANVLLVTGYSFPTSAQVQFDVAPADGAAIILRRETPVNPIVTYTNAAALKASNLNISNKQSLYVVQEIADVTIGEFLVGQELLDARDLAVQAAIDAALARNAAVDAQELAELAEAGAETALAAAEAIVEALSATYDIGNSVPFLPAAGEVCMVHAVTRTITLPAEAPGSYVTLAETGSGDLEITFYKNGVSFGTCVVSSGGSVGTFTVAEDVFFTTGDVIVARVTSANSSAAPSGFGITLKCSLEI